LDVTRALFALKANARAAHKAVLAPLGMMLTAMATTLLISCSTPTVDAVTAIKARGFLRVAVPVDLLPAESLPSASFDLALAKGFADQLGAELHIVSVSNESELVNAVRNGQADLALAMPQRLARENALAFTSPYHAIEYVVVGKNGDALALSLPEITREIRVNAGSAAASVLIESKSDLPSLRWTESSSSTIDVLGEIIDEKISYSVISDYALAPSMLRFPDLRIAFQLNMPDALTWAFAPINQAGLMQMADSYLRQQIQKGTVATLRSALLPKPRELDFLERRRIADAVLTRLPDLREHFVSSAGPDLDWRFIAAIAYQESHWRANAVSGTGVTGIMMLTEDTAAQMGVTDRTDPQQSIRGGADYFRNLIEKIPERITGFDRIAFTLAAYNIGFRHLEDARLLTARRGGNKDQWRDVKKHLPALRDPLIYSTLRYGYARGDEAVEFVENVYRYHDALQWLDTVNDATMARRMAGKALPGMHHELPSAVNVVVQSAIADE
jgi:membrane-bound lytic murein transglycosylase F